MTLIVLTGSALRVDLVFPLAREVEGASQHGETFAPVESPIDEGGAPQPPLLNDLYGPLKRSNVRHRSPARSVHVSAADQCRHMGEAVRKALGALRRAS